MASKHLKQGEHTVYHNIKPGTHNHFTWFIGSHGQLFLPCLYMVSNLIGKKSLAISRCDNMSSTFEMQPGSARLS